MNADSAEDLAAFKELKHLAESLIDQNRFSEARSHANALLTNFPVDPEVYALLASIELNCGRLALARRYMLEALRLAPAPEIAKENLAYLDTLEAQITDNEYIHRWLVLRVLHLDWPRMIHLETVGRCNAKCNFCPHPQLDRKFDAMSDELFEKIVREASTFPEDRFVGFFMHAVNEPFMDRKIFDRLSFINETVPHAAIGITTNMNVMPPRFFERIRKIRNISYWNVSFNAANKLEYEEAMQIDFARTVSNIKRLLSENRASRFVAKTISLSRVCTNDDRDDIFADQCRELFPDFVSGEDFEPGLLGKANWLGAIDQPALGFSYPCTQWMNITIHCNGIVPHCCVDAKAQFPFGDANKQSILEIYNNPYWRNLRESVSSRDVVYPCKTCNLR